MSTTKRVNSTLIQNPYYFLTLPIPKQKRIKSNPVPSKSYNIPTVPRDSHGLPLLPLNVGIMTLMSLGSICFRQKFHSERYIFPVGYEVTRRYLSTVSPTAQVVYHCTIIDGGDSPKFQVVGADRVDRPVIASTATGAWSVIVKEANRIRKRTHSNSVSGPDFFGLGQNTIRHLIQQLPGAEKLAKRDQPSDDGGGFYVWQHYTEGGPLGGRHAAVIPALPDDFESAIGPIGEYIPPRIIQGPPTPSTSQSTDNQAPTPTSSAIPLSLNPTRVSLGTGLSYYPPHVLAQAQQQPPRNPQHPNQSSSKSDLPSSSQKVQGLNQLLQQSSSTGGEQPPTPSAASGQSSLETSQMTTVPPASDLMPSLSQDISAASPDHAFIEAISRDATDTAVMEVHDPRVQATIVGLLNELAKAGVSRNATEEPTDTGEGNGRSDAETAEEVQGAQRDSTSVS